MNHVLVKHVNCELQRCHICDGGLEACTVCLGGEASLTTECCGRVLTDSELDAVMAGDLDYVDGAFVDRDGFPSN